MSKALEAARRAIEAHPAYDCGSTGDEEMARAAITAYMAHLAEDDEVVERVARAIQKHVSIGGAPHQPRVIGERTAARAALAALKEPT